MTVKEFCGVTPIGLGVVISEYDDLTGPRKLAYKPSLLSADPCIPDDVLDREVEFFIPNDEAVFCKDKDMINIYVKPYEIPFDTVEEE